MRGKPSYSPPAVDSDVAIANARHFLFTSTPTALAGVTVDQVAGRYRLSAKRAEYELTIARQQRGTA